MDIRTSVERIASFKHSSCPADMAIEQTISRLPDLREETVPIPASFSSSLQPDQDAKEEAI